MIESKGLPSAGRVTLLHQENQKRFIIHLLYAPPLERGRCLVIEDLPEIHNVELYINLGKRIKNAYFLNLNKNIRITQNKKINVTVDKFRMHEALILEY